jgi:hypothetical protein
MKTIDESERVTAVETKSGKFSQRRNRDKHNHGSMLNATRKEGTPERRHVDSHEILLAYGGKRRRYMRVSQMKTVKIFLNLIY